MLYDTFVRRACQGLDLDWRKYRRKQSRKAVEGRMRELGLAGFDQYLDKIRDDPGEASALPDRMRVTVSRFFREKDCWRELTDQVLPELADKVSSSYLRALCLGINNGEEPYSLVLLWKQSMEPLYPDVGLRIFGVDMDAGCLARAKERTYHGRTLREVPEEIQSRWFTQSKGMYVLDREPAAMVEFSQAHLMDPGLPGQLDLLLCRYLVFTYFTGVRRKKAVERLARLVKPGGKLMIGRKETLRPDEFVWFAPLSSARFIAQRTSKSVPP